MPEKTPKPQKNTPPERFQPKVLLLWVVIITAIVALWYSTPGVSGNQLVLGVSELMEAVEAGQIAKDSGVMKPDPSLGEEGYIITGEMSSLVEAGEDSPKIPYRVEGRLTEADFLKSVSYTHLTLPTKA